MKQTIEVEVGPEDENGWCRVESVGADGAHYVTGVSADTLRNIGLTVPDPAPDPGPTVDMTVLGDSVKMIRETLCVAQGDVGRNRDPRDRRDEHVARLQRLIDICDMHRPIGTDGKHGNRHTTTCGCDDVAVPEPKHTRSCIEYDLRNQGFAADEVLVAAHSVRDGDRVEWAPGDWREITDVADHCLVITFWFDDEPFSLNRWDLLAVRR